jgi:hypothetical protein
MWECEYDDAVTAWAAGYGEFRCWRCSWLCVAATRAKRLGERYKRREDTDGIVQHISIPERPH